jgi:hypothetical protein
MYRLILFTILFAACPFLIAFEYQLPALEINTAILREDIPARLIELKGICDYQNSSDQAITRFYHRVTMPPSNSPYQILVGVEGDYLEKATAEQHKNGIDQFLSFCFSLPAKTTMQHQVCFKILLLPVDYMKAQPSVAKLQLREEDKTFIQPSQYIESDANLIKNIAHSFKQQAEGNIVAQTKLAYEFPAKHLKFKPQNPIGALAALKSKQGDCTEFSALCIALCRAQGIPARQTGVFHIRNNQETFQQPNHNSAEVFWGDIGWVPIDSNLGGGKYDSEYGFARTGNSVILLKREGAWVWSNYLPQSGYDTTKPKPSLAPKMTWTTKILEEDSAQSPVKKHCGLKK